MKQKDFIFNICLLLFLNLLIKPFWLLGIDVGVQNQVGAEAYGLYFAIFNFTFLFDIILDMGITNFNNRNIARNSQLIDKHTSSIISLRLILGVIYMITVFIVALTIGYRGLQLKLLFWTAINQFLSTFIVYLRSNISALMMFKTDSCLSILDRLLMIIFCSMLLWGHCTAQPFRIEWFVYCQTAAYTITMVIVLFIVIRKSKLKRLHWNWPFFVMIIKQSLPFALLYMLMACYNRIDSVMIERILPHGIGAEQAGIYASAFRLLDALVMIAYLFSVILLPLFSKMLKKQEDIQPITRASFSLLYFFSLTATVLLLGYKIPVLSWLYHDHIQESAAVFSLLIPNIIPVSMTYIFGSLLTANGNMKALNISASIGILVNIIVNIILIPHLQARGAAIASLSTQSIVSLIQIIIAFRLLKIPVSVIPWVSTILYTGLLILTVILTTHLFHGRALIALLIAGSIAIALGFATRLIRLRDTTALATQNKTDK